MKVMARPTPLAVDFHIKHKELWAVGADLGKSVRTISTI
jgi:hypothetical protein